MGKNRKNRLKIGVKYCGGCKPNYDRVELTAKLKERLEDKVEFMSHDSPGLFMVIAVQGCPTACADLSHIEVPVRTITGCEEAEKFISYIENIFAQKQNKEAGN
ncbi:MAG: hypothetical protein KGY38_05930 [Desulfobacterales bacterium]|nr:hypothetical protein [Desulfobacterales bacterium]